MKKVDRQSELGSRKCYKAKSTCCRSTVGGPQVFFTSYLLFLVFTRFHYDPTYDVSLALLFVVTAAAIL